MLDYLLDLSFDSRGAGLEEELSARLFLTESTGSVSNEVNGTTTITAYFDSAAARDAAVEALGAIDGVETRSRERERQDWLELYQQSLEPLFIGDRFVVAPEARLIPHHTDRLTLIVPQEQGFGTGSHETTALCIELLAALQLRGKRGLDVGSGSGILALAMLRLEAARAIAFDNDPDAYAALRDNRMRNGIEDAAMPLFIGSIEALRGGTFDLITMNIIPEVILPLLGQVVARLAPAGTMILSGILLERRDEILAAAATHGLQLQSEKSRGEWWGGVVRAMSDEG